LLPIGLGGNKLRNLEFLIGAARAQDADTLVTVGRRWSNHARLTAAAGARAGLRVHLVLTGPPSAPPNPGIRLDELFGAVVHVAATDHRSDRDALLESVVATLQAEGRRLYVIAAGGSGTIGATGQVLAGLELFEQAAGSGTEVDRIVVPSATGGTQAGLVVAASMASPRTGVTGVVVARPPSELRPAIDAMVADLGDGASVPEIELDESQLGDGYGRPTAAAEGATRLLASTEGILVDPIYTAKALAALLARVRAGAWDEQTIVFWHAGGLPGLFEPLDARGADGNDPGPVR
jgi:1-aminocyclopropane-1-carboxylate deaminase/D-cysteine desulfhydrase-like pyridoxal-dependent ACC family enzyme